MLRVMMLPAIMMATVAFSHGHKDHSSAIHTGSGKAFHQGDYVSFDLEFKSACYNDSSEALNTVVNNVAQFADWLAQTNGAWAGGGLSYNIDLINTWRDDNDECDGKYFASQAVTISITKSAHEAGLTNESIQEFYNAIQYTIAPYTYSDVPNLNAETTAKVTEVTKGLFEESIDTLRRAAKAKAQEKATADFLSSLGSDYSGWWYLYSANFGERSYSYETSSSAMPRSGRISDAPPAQLKLKPLSISAEGIFIFHLESNKNYYPKN